ncbi:tetratricopeptide repeat protein, partial [bacterium]|nr:tetratricopeptide repeat protein [bacterium]
LYQKLLKENPGSLLVREINFELGKTFQNLERWEEAIKAYQKVIQKTEDELEVEAQFRMADSYRKLRNFEEAAIEYLKVVYYYSAFPEWVLRAEEEAALCLEKQGRWKDAKRIYEKMIQADPEGVKGELARGRIREIEEKEEK